MVDNNKSSRRAVLKSAVATATLAGSAGLGAAQPGNGNSNGRGQGNGRGQPTLTLESWGGGIRFERNETGPTTTFTIATTGALYANDETHRYTFTLEPGESLRQNTMNGVRWGYYVVEEIHPRGVAIEPRHPVAANPTITGAPDLDPIDEPDHPAAVRPRR